MPPTQLKPGGEIDAWCTQCKADKVHRIIALVGPTPKRVECLSCKGHHMYRATQAQKDAAAAHKRASRDEPRAAAPSTAPTRGTRAPRGASAARKREDDLHAAWERAVTGKDFAAFKPYRIDKVFAKGELVRHSKFGEGIVATILDANKCEILFKDGMRTLAQSMQLSG
jgi:hypothetical protein